MQINQRVAVTPEENPSRATAQTALEIGYLLDEYRIEAILGFGGFGITYRAVDSKDRLATQVAIKEYFPRSVAVRQDDRVTVSLHHENERQDFEKGLQRFIEEAQVLREFRHPAVVKVLRLYEKNGTAYMIMEYVPGETLADWLEKNPQPEEARLKQIFDPILQGLDYVHQRNFLHRDIKPQNIYIRQQGGAMLLDFGSARQSIGNHTAMVTPGFAPFEQYHSQNLGPWSDIYGIGATLYYCINHMKAPMDTLRRFGDLQQGSQDPLASAMEIGKGHYSEVFLSSIDWMLQPLYQKRPQNISSILEYWQQDQVEDHGRVEAITIYPEQLNSPEFVAHRDDSPSPKKITKGPSFTTGVAIGFTVLLAVLLAWFLTSGGKSSQPAEEPAKEQAIAKVLDEEPLLVSETQAEKIREPAKVEKPVQSTPDKVVIQEAQETDQTAKQEELPEVVSQPEETLPEAIDEAPEEIQTEVVTQPTDESSQPALVRVTIKSRPRDAIVSIDGVDRGLTPLTVTLDAVKAKNAEISLRKTGYRIWRNRLALEKDKNSEIFAQLSAITRVTPKPRPAPVSPLDSLRSRAQGGDRDAQVKLGQRYETGRGVKQNYRQAAAWYGKAAQQGHDVAQLNLGYLYEKGRGVPLNLAQAVHWYTRSANQGNSIAQTNLGLMYQHGRGVQRDYRESVRWYLRAAEQGNPSAQNALGLLYIKGKGIRRNFRQAAHWFRRAVEQNHSQAQVNLGLLYERGLGVRRNRQKAVQFYRQAAAQGNRQAKRRLMKLGLL